MPETADQNVLATHLLQALVFTRHSLARGFRIGGGIVRTIALTARFDHAADVSLDELRAELTYPLDKQADRYFRGQGSADAGR